MYNLHYNACYYYVYNIILFCVKDIPQPIRFQHANLPANFFHFKIRIHPRSPCTI